MRVLRMIAVATAILLAVGAGSARADLAGQGDPFSLIFDEFGNGLPSQTDVDGNAGPYGAYNGQVLPDFTGGVAGNALMWLLPELVGTGDVAFTDLGGTFLSDVFRFA